MNLPTPVTPQNTPTVASMVGDFNKTANNFAIQQGVQPQIQLPQVNIPIPNVNSLIWNFNSFAPSTFDFNKTVEQNNLKNELWLNAQSDIENQLKDANTLARGEWIFSSLSKIGDMIPTISPFSDSFEDSLNKFSPIGNFLDYFSEKEITWWKKKIEQINKAIWQEQVTTTNLQFGQTTQWLWNSYSSKFGNIIWNSFEKAEDSKWWAKALAIGTAQSVLDLWSYAQSRNTYSKFLKEQWKTQEANKSSETTDYNINLIQTKQVQYVKDLKDIRDGWKSLRQAEVILQNRYNEMWFRWINWYFSDWFKQDDWSIYDGRTIDQNNAGFTIQWSASNIRTRKDLFNQQQNNADFEMLNVTDIYSAARKWVWYIGKVLAPIFNTASASIWDLWAQTVGTTIWFASSSADLSDYTATSFGWKTEWIGSWSYKFANNIFDTLPEIITNLWVARLLWPSQWLNAVKWTVLRAPWYTSKVNQALELFKYKPLNFFNNVDSLATVWNLLKQWWKTILSESIINAWFDSTQQSTNSEPNFLWNVRGSIFWFAPEIWELVSSWRKLFNIEEWWYIIENSFKVRKKLELLDSWKTLQDADDLVNKMKPSEYLVDAVGNKVEINDNLIDTILKQKEVALAAKKNYNDTLKFSIKKRTEEIDTITDPALRWTKQAELDNDIADYETFNKSFNSSLSQELALHNLLKDSRFRNGEFKTEELEEFASIIKTWLVWAENPEEYTRFLFNYAMGVWWDTLKLTTQALEEWASQLTKSYQIDNFTKTTWYDISSSYDEKWFNKIMNDIKDKSNTYSYLFDKIDWEYTYWARTDAWARYELNAKWLEKMWTDELNVVINLRRTMVNIPEWSEEAVFLKEIKNKDYWLTDLEKKDIKELRAYDILLNNINNFIPCIP